MRRTAVTTLVLAAVVAAGSTAQQAAIAFTNGQWFDGERFVAGTRYVVGQRFVDTAPQQIDRTIDLGGGFVVPPFGEAHNHNTSVAKLTTYLAQGIFYVKNPNSFPNDRASVATAINRPSTVDVVFANGGLTGIGGHPITIVDRGIARGQMVPADGDGAFYHVIPTLEALVRRWPSILAGDPDFLKIYLLYSERHSERTGDPKAYGWTGLDPALAPAIVARAHAAGLRVSAHVESGADFAVAVAAGVDEISHLPGFRGPAPDIAPGPATYALPDDAVRQAALNGTVVVTTVSGLEELPDEPQFAEIRRNAEAAIRTSLAQLHMAGVRLAVGSDRYEFSALDEALFLERLEIFDNRTLLKMWTEITPATIFPNRRIGRIAEGYEASFLVLEANPLDDFAAVRRIRLRIKQGTALP